MFDWILSYQRQIIFAGVLIDIKLALVNQLIEAECGIYASVI